MRLLEIGTASYEKLLQRIPTRAKRQRSLRDRGHTFISPAIKREVLKDCFQQMSLSICLIVIDLLIQPYCVKPHVCCDSICCE